MSIDTLFEPANVAGLDLPNRFAMAPMTRQFSPGGVPGEDVADYYARRSAAGIGLIITEGTYVDHPSAGNTPRVPDFFGAEAAAGWKRVAERVHAAGGLIVPQLWHVGINRDTRNGGGSPDLTFSPSAISLKGREHGHAMTTQDIDDLVASYARGAALAQELGFDGAEIHAAHGYLIDQFLWKFTNRRTDSYGGEAAARARFGAEIVAAIRSAVGPDFPIIFRFSQWKGGHYDAKSADTPDELAALLTPISDAGASIFHPSTRRFWLPEFDGSDLTLAGWAKQITGKPVIAVGSVGLGGAYEPGADVRVPTSDLTKVGEIFDRGDFDLVAVGRALLANYDWAEKVRTQRSEELRAYSHDLESVLR
ncbi:MAG: 1,2-oxophytodienoate reductase [Nocardioidaceae bacterium]|nr:1,2-oxophytodienoate reductase [Nocardioidaceae bacterium]